MAAFDKVACPFSVSRRSVLQFAVEPRSPDYQRTSPTSESWCPLCRTFCNQRSTPNLLIDVPNFKRQVVGVFLSLYFCKFLKSHDILK